MPGTTYFPLLYLPPISSKNLLLTVGIIPGTMGERAITKGKTMKEFFHYNDGVRISDSTINEWLGVIRHYLLQGDTRATISYGDCSVIGIEWPTEYEFFVANSSGKSTIRFGKRDDLEEMKNFEFNYKRPIDKQQ